MMVAGIARPLLGTGARPPRKGRSSSPPTSCPPFGCCSSSIRSNGFSVPSFGKESARCLFRPICQLPGKKRRIVAPNLRCCWLCLRWATGEFCSDEEDRRRGVAEEGGDDERRRHWLLGCWWCRPRSGDCGTMAGVWMVEEWLSPLPELLLLLLLLLWAVGTWRKTTALPSCC